MRDMTARQPAHHESDASVNSGAADSSDDDVMIDRPDDEDHDLLTFGEAGARLEEEVIKQERTIERLRRGNADDATIAGAERRLETLQRARSRNRAPSLDDLKSSGFFGTRD